MVLEWYWVVITTALLLFFSILTYFIGHRRGYGKGYKVGGFEVLEEWKKYNREMGIDDN